MAKDAVIFETPHWRVLLRADDQTYLGRAVIVCRRAASSLSELTKEEWTDLKCVMTRYETACKKVFGATMFNWTCLMNDAYQHDPPDPQAHWHVRPRYAKPMTFAGEAFTDEAFGHHYERKTNREVSDGVAREIAVALQKQLV